MLGQVNFNGNVLPYSLTTSVGIENGEVTRWDIDEIELQDLLTDVLNQKIALNLLAINENPILNLYYFEANTSVDIGYSEGSTFSGMNWFWLVECKGYPWRKTLPVEKTALREFSVNQGWNKNNAQLVLIDEGVRLYNFYSKDPSGENSLLSYLLPNELIISDMPQLGINGQFTYGPYIYLTWGDATQEEIASYMKIINNLPGTKEYFDWGVSVEDAFFVVNEEGTLDIVECRQN